MQSEPPRAVSDEEIRQFERDGIVVLRGFFDKGWLEKLAVLAEQVMADPGPLSMELEKGDGPGRFFFDTFMWTRIEGFRDFVFRSPAAAVAGALMGASKVNIFFDQLLIKEPGTRERTPWHHDQTYWPVRGSQVCSLWLALDHVDKASGAVEYVRGSHKWGTWYKPPAFAGDDRYQIELPPVPDVEAIRDELDIIQFEMEPGDCTVHHGLLVHGAPGNSVADRRRRAVVTRWAGDDAIYAPHPKIQPMAWDPDIPPGGPLDSDLWPIVWQARH